MFRLAFNIVSTSYSWKINTVETKMVNFLLSIFESNSFAVFTELLTFTPTRLYDFGQKYSTSSGLPNLLIGNFGQVSAKVGS